MDLITAEIIREYLLTVSEEMSETVTRTAMSPVFNEGHDYSTAIFYFDGRQISLIARATVVPEHIYASLVSLEVMLKTFEADIHEGDIGLVNDPYFGGSHLPDWTIMKPVFFEGKPTFFPVVRAHQLDVGGPVAACKNAYAKTIWQEGFRIYPIKLVEQGKTREDVWRVLLANTRLASDVDNDLRAMIGACKIAEDRIRSLVSKYGIGEVSESVGYILNYSEKRFREEISTWPDGEYEGQAFLDSDWGGGHKDININCKVNVKADNISIDLAGSHPQVEGCVNSPAGNTASWLYTPLTAICPDIPVNSGFLRPVKLILPRGTVVNPDPPYPTGQSTVCVGNQICEALMAALEKCIPEKVATAGLDLTFLYNWGIDGRHGNYFLGLDYIASACSAGGTYGQDGWGGYTATHCALRIPTYEMTEIQFPYLYHRGEYVTDSAAPGKWRGVPAWELVREMTNAKDATVNMFVQSYKYPLRGYVGGKPGTGNWFVVNPSKPDEIFVDSFLDRSPSPPGQVVLARSGGGGGWGDPLERDPQMVLDDVLDEYVSIEGAEKDYGVLINRETMKVDEEETRKLREKRKRG